MTVTWKSFKFFKKSEERVVQFPHATACCTKGISEIIFGCDGGEIVILDTGLQDKICFPAYGNRVFQAQYLQKSKLLMTLGSEEPGVSSTTMKIWDIEKIIPSPGNSAQPIRNQKIFSQKYPESEITAIAVYEVSNHMTYVALGLASGFVYWIQGDLVKDRMIINQLDARPLGSDLWCVKGMGFSESLIGLQLFVVTESQTILFDIQTGNKNILDEVGGTDGSVMMRNDGHLLVARSQAVYFYNTDGRGACFAFNEQHHHLAWTGKNLVVVHDTILPNGVSNSEVKILDLYNKLEVGKEYVSNVRHVFCAWGMIFIVQGDGTIYLLREVALNTKLDSLFRRMCHNVALRIAEAEGADPSTLAHVYQEYADHLYKDKRDYDAAMQQYLHTIGFLEPSYVIRKYLDAQRILQLTSYLEALHDQCYATADHTTLLLNCYTKLKDVENLDKFVGIGMTDMDLKRTKNASTQKRKFDVETAVKVLRSSCYYNHALEVAKTANEPHWYLDILLEDMGNYDEGIQFVFDLPRKEAAEALKKYGKLLVAHRPKNSTKCLMNLCVPAPVSSTDPNSSFVASVSDFTHLYANKPRALIELCEFVFETYRRQIASSPPGEDLLYHTLLELYLSNYRDVTNTDANKRDETISTISGEFDSNASIEERREKALTLLRGGWAPGESPKYDPEHILIMCRMYDFREGIVFLYERKGLLREVLQVYIDDRDYEGIIYACEKYGDASKGGDPQLWSEALEYFSSHNEDCTEQLHEVLEHVEQQDVLPPLAVLHTLAKNPKLKLEVVKEYISKQLHKDSKSIQEDRNEISRLQEETNVMKERIHKLKTEPQVFQRNMDELTKEPLELPSIHFLCQHSFNERTLEEDVSECPLCSAQNREILRIRRDMKAGTAHQEQFFMELKGKKDGFGVIAEWFGRGMLNVKSQTHSNK